MQPATQLGPKGFMHGARAFDAAPTTEEGRDEADGKMGLALRARASVAGVARGIVGDLKRARREGGAEGGGDAILARLHCADIGGLSCRAKGSGGGIRAVLPGARAVSRCQKGV
jgi:hypothetical protein